MHRDVVLSIDQGTTNTKVLLVDREGRVLSRASVPITQSYPQPGWVEQDANTIWQSVRDAVNVVLSDPADIRIVAIGIANQRETATAWDRKTGKPLGPAIGWQCRRTSPICDELRARDLDSLLRQRTGLAIDPLFSATKMRWLLDSIDSGAERAQSGDICLGTIDSWLLWNLTGGAVHATDVSNASRTQLLNIQKLEWDKELLDIFDIPRAALAEVRPSACVFGEGVSSGLLPSGIPIFSLIGDSHAALFGHKGFRSGVVKATYGTGSSLMMPSNGPLLSKNGLSTTVAWAREGSGSVYALEGNIPVTGAAVQWLGEFLGLDEPVSGVVDLAESAKSSEGVTIVPAFVGLGAPYWDDAARGIIVGLTRGTTSAHLARATLESIALLIRDVFDAMETDAGQKLEKLLADGGASQNNQLMQIQADILGCVVMRNNSSDVSALGAAYLAGLVAKMWSSESEIEELQHSYDRFEPRISPNERENFVSRWQIAVARARLESGLMSELKTTTMKGKSYGTNR